MRVSHSVLSLGVVRSPPSTSCLRPHPRHEHPPPAAPQPARLRALHRRRHTGTGRATAHHRADSRRGLASHDRKQPPGARQPAAAAGHAGQALRGHRLQRRDRGAALEEARRGLSRPVLVCAGQPGRRRGSLRGRRHQEDRAELVQERDHCAQGQRPRQDRRPQGPQLRLRRPDLRIGPPVSEGRPAAGRAGPRHLLRPCDLLGLARRQHPGRGQQEGRRRRGGRPHPGQRHRQGAGEAGRARDRLVLQPHSRVAHGLAQGPRPGAEGKDRQGPGQREGLAVGRPGRAQRLPADQRRGLQRRARHRQGAQARPAEPWPTAASSGSTAWTR